APTGTPARDLRLTLTAVPGVLYTEAVQQELRAAPGLVVRPEPSRRRLRRNVCRLVDTEQRVAASLCWLEGPSQARVHGRTDGIAPRSAGARRQPSRG